MLCYAVLCCLRAARADDDGHAALLAAALVLAAVDAPGGPADAAVALDLRLELLLRLVLRHLLLALVEEVVPPLPEASLGEGPMVYIIIIITIL